MKQDHIQGKTSNTYKQKVKRYEKVIRCYTKSVAPVYNCEIFRLINKLGSTWDAPGYFYSVTRISIKKKTTISKDKS